MQLGDDLGKFPVRAQHIVVGVQELPEVDEELQRLFIKINIHNLILQETSKLNINAFYNECYL